MLQSIIEDLDRLFPQQINLSIEDTAKTIGLCIDTLRNKSCKNTLPFRTFKIGTRRFVLKRDLAIYLEDIATPKPKRGRPTKAQSIAKQASAQSVGCVA